MFLFVLFDVSTCKQASRGDGPIDSNSPLGRSEKMLGAKGGYGKHPIHPFWLVQV